MSPLLLPPGLGLTSTLGVTGHPTKRVHLRWPGFDPIEPSLDVLIFDDSWSLRSDIGNDPVGQRYAEARRALRLLSRWSTSARQQVAVLHFDYPQVALEGPHRLDRASGRDHVLGMLREPPKANGSSMLGPAMTAAVGLAREHGGTARCTIFSDFELTDLNQVQPYDEIARFPGAVHAVVLNTVPPAPLEDPEQTTITRITTDSPPGLAAAALMHSLTADRRGAQPASLRRGRKRMTR